MTQGFDPSKPGFHSGLVSAEMRTNFVALNTHHKGTPAPTTPADGQIWLDDTSASDVLMKLYRTASANWITLFSFLNGTGLLNVPVLNYTHTQSVANTTWTITHNMKKYPSVTPVNNSNVKYMDASISSITYDSIDQITIVFTSAVTGYAYLT